MKALVAFLLLCSTVAAADKLLYFGASWCGPCQRMKPVVAKLEANGYAVEHIDVDRDKASTAAYKVRSIPCFVMLKGGFESGRIVGATSYERLTKLYGEKR